MRIRARIGAGGIVLLALLFFLLVACGVEAQSVDNTTVKRAGEYEASMDANPNPPKAGGTAELTFTVLKGGETVEDSGTAPRLTVDMPKMPMNLPEVPLEYAGSGQWRAKNVQFPMAGGWEATLAIPSSDGAENVAFDFDVAP